MGIANKRPEDIRGLKFKSKELKLFQYGNDGQIALDGSEGVAHPVCNTQLNILLKKNNSYPLLKCVPKIKEGKIFYLRISN
jgi:hypothetical protein